MKKLIALIPTTGKNKEQLSKEANRILREKGYLKAEVPKKKSKITFLPTYEKKFPFIGWVELKKPHPETPVDLRVYLINPTDKKYEKVELYSGSNCDGMESVRIAKHLGELNPHSWIQIDGMTWEELDFFYWYHLDFYSQSSKKPECYMLLLGNYYSWRKEEIGMLPVLNTEGIKLALSPRGEEPISEEIKKDDPLDYTNYKK